METGESAERTLAPSLQARVEFGSGVADLRGADGVSAEFFKDGGDFAGGYTLDIHFAHRERKRLFAPGALLGGARVEGHAVADLGYAKVDSPAPERGGLWLEAIGAPEAVFGALTGLRLKHGRALLEHGLVDEDAHGVGEMLRGVFGQELQNGVDQFRIALVGHVRVCCWLYFEDTPTGNRIVQPLASFSRHPCRGRLRCGSLCSPPLGPPGRGAQRSREAIPKETLHPRIIEIEEKF